jgi:RimJ/RimL family protein N-acetyltransferase
MARRLIDRVRSLVLPLRTRRLELHWPSLAFGKELIGLLQDPTVVRWTLRIPSPYTRDHAVAWLRRARRSRRKAEGLSFLLVRQRDSALVGGIGLHLLDETNRSAEIGYWIGAPFRRQGYGKEAVAAVTRLAFSALGLHRLEAHVFRGNEASAQLLKGNGFRREGLHRGRVQKDGHFVDEVCYARLSSDPAPSEPRRAGRADAGMVRPTR